ncbi:M14 family zinc carboxypeptidase [Nocardia sp. NPDC127526]|uniref:M14 family zinc carboxypeptidase n=1 Tax=Nocardia sp. NPDC127526 TaxID=3345393 RepID=UPI003625B9F9
MGYQTSSAIDATVTALAAGFSSHATKFTLPIPTHDNKSIVGLKIANASAPDRIPVLFTGGVHAREWAPPDALLGFCTRLLAAATTNTAITYAPFTDADGVVYEGYTVSAARVQAIADKFDVFVVPCANPDGRDFSMRGAAQLHKMWRKNRRPDPCPGVDLNRNFAITWDADTYFSAAAAPTANVSKNPCSDVFRGPSPASEPETRNLAALVANERIQYLVDVHMSGRTILFPWGMETDQSNEPGKSFLNPLFDRTPLNPAGGRDGLLGTAYAEFVPDNVLDPRGRLHERLRLLADSMALEILTSAGPNPNAKRRSTYIPKQSVGLYPTTGAFDDFTFSTQFTNPLLPNIHAYTLECGLERGGIPSDPTDDDGGFWPDFVKQFPKVEREVHAALFGLLSAI